MALASDEQEKPPPGQIARRRACNGTITTASEKAAGRAKVQSIFVMQQYQRQNRTGNVGAHPKLGIADNRFGSGGQ